MPIKLPKGFARRKSSGNALEDVENPPQPSFRVFERPSVERKSLSDGNLVSQSLGNGHSSYSPPEDDNIFSGSDGPPFRNLTGGTYEGPPSTVRFSSSARRSTDGPTQFDTQSPHSRNLHDIPLPPFSGALRAAGRTFSFGGRFSKTSTAPVPPPASTPDPARGRAMTASTTSTTSTATPPKLLDTDLQISRIDDDFGNMFDDIGKRDLRDSEPSNSESFSGNSRIFFRKEEKLPRPTPISTDRSKEVEPSPYSWSSQHSEEGLLNTIESPREDQSAFQSNPTSPSAMLFGSRRKSLPLNNAAPITTTSHRSLEKPKATADKGLRRSVMFSTKRDTAAVEDEDAKLIMDSLYSTKRASQLPFSASQDVDAEDDAPLFGNGHAIKTVSEPQKESPPVRTAVVPESSDDHIDPSIEAHARLAAQYESQPIPATSSNKIMTPSQFEHYRQQQELKRANSDASSSEDEAESDFDEEDEAEKNREAERQRRKQEAHLSVYRQQMMKVTGQQSPSPSLRPEMDRASASTPNLTAPSLHPGNPSGSGKSSEGDDDDEIPLGILAAHGFPNRNRPPSRLAPSNSMQNLRASFNQPYVGSPGSTEDIGNRASLPVFARNLPRDPYFGAGLVNQPNRESLALGGGGGSVYGGPSAASPALPPGGLIGVIATEERARAMRRGSPNPQAMYEYQPGMQGGAPAPTGGIPRPYTMLNLNSVNGPGVQQPVSATEQAQIQLSHQMTHMMQMQMQWMQQMIQMQGGQAPPPQLMPPGSMPLGSMPPGGIQPPFLANINSRPSSMPSAAGAFGNVPPQGFAGNQRTLSMLDPNMSSRLNNSSTPFLAGGNRPGTPGGNGYAPSLAPSERSNVGLAPRYRPVSTVPVEAESAAYLSNSRPWNDENRRASVLTSSASSNLSKMTVRPISSHSKSLTAISKLANQVEADDEDEDEGWAEMMKNREKKRTNWKIKKESSTFGDLLNAVH